MSPASETAFQAVYAQGLTNITMLQKIYHYRHVNCTTYMCGEWYGSCQMNILCHSCFNYTHDAADDGIVFRAHIIYLIHSARCASVTSLNTQVYVYA